MLIFSRVEKLMSKKNIKLQNILTLLLAAFLSFTSCNNINIKKEAK